MNKCSGWQEELQKLLFGKPSRAQLIKFCRRLLNEMEASQSNAVADRQLLNELNKKLTRLQNLDTLLSQILELVKEHLQVERCTLLLLDETQNHLRFMAGTGQGVEQLRNITISLGEGIAGQVAISGVPLLIQDIENDPQFHKISSNQYHTKSLLSVPLIAQEQIIGVIQQMIF